MHQPAVDLKRKSVLDVGTVPAWEPLREWVSATTPSRAEQLRRLLQGEWFEARRREVTLETPGPVLVEPN